MREANFTLNCTPTQNSHLALICILVLGFLRRCCGSRGRCRIFSFFGLSILFTSVCIAPAFATDVAFGGLLGGQVVTLHLWIRDGVSEGGSEVRCGNQIFCVTLTLHPDT